MQDFFEFQAGERGHPGGVAFMPTEGVATYFLVMLGRNIDKGIGETEVVLLRLFADVMTLHRASGNEQVEVLSMNLTVGGIG